MGVNRECYGGNKKRPPQDFPGWPFLRHTMKGDLLNHNRRETGWVTLILPVISRFHRDGAVSRCGVVAGFQVKVPPRINHIVLELMVIRANE